MTLVAQCSNCASWQKAPLDAGAGHATLAVSGFCGRSLAADPGDVLCQQYQASKAFAQEIISTMLKEQGPMALPVKLVGGRQSARRLRKEQEKRLRGGKR